MSTSMVIFLAVGLSLFFIACVFAIALFWIKRLRREAALALRSEVGEQKVFNVAGCNFVGILSSGYAQVRGNGLLALTDAGLHFRMLRPRRYHFIPFDSILELSHPRWFLGKTKSQKLLRVDFTNQHGKDDACAWLVRSPRWWAEAITALKEGGEPSTNKVR